MRIPSGIRRVVAPSHHNGRTSASQRPHQSCSGPGVYHIAAPAVLINHTPELRISSQLNNCKKTCTERSRRDIPTSSLFFRYIRERTNQLRQPTGDAFPNREAKTHFSRPHQALHPAESGVPQETLLPGWAERQTFFLVPCPSLSPPAKTIVYGNILRKYVGICTCTY